MKKEIFVQTLNNGSHDGFLVDYRELDKVVKYETPLSYFGNIMDIFGAVYMWFGTLVGKTNYFMKVEFDK